MFFVKCLTDDSELDDLLRSGTEARSASLDRASGALRQVGECGRDQVFCLFRVRVGFASFLNLQLWRLNA